LVLTRVKGLKKPTFEGWCKPRSPVRTHPKLQHKWTELQDTVRFCLRMGDKDIRNVLDRFLQDDRGPRKSALSKSQLEGFLLKKLETREHGFTHIDTIASQ
jgi:hypothetical protein